MNIEDAKKIIERYEPLKENFITTAEYKAFCEALDLAVDALEKQISRKVNETGLKFKALDIDTKEIAMYKCSPCPTCGKWITKIYNYCSHCGQKLDWD